MTTMTMATDDDNDDDDDDDNGAMTTMTTTTTMASINNEAIRKVLATFNRKSQCAEEYVIPPKRFFARDTNKQ
jgi:hypothetical protein